MRPKYSVVIHLVVKDTRIGDGEIVESKVQHKFKSISQGCKP